MQAVKQCTDTSMQCQQQVRKIATHELSRVNPPSYDGSEDIADLTYLNEASVVHNLKTRYLDKSIYVRTLRDSIRPLRCSKDADLSTLISMFQS